MIILITGAAGFIGTHLSKAFLDQGHQVIGIDNLSTGNMENIKNFTKESNYQFYQKNLEDFTSLEEPIQKCDLIYHLASVVGVDLVDKEPHKTINDNMTMALKLFPLAEKYNKKIIFTSTSEVYGDLNSSDGFKEDQALQIKPPTKLRWGYASTKLTQEFLLYSYDFPFVIARLFNVVGPKQKGDFGMVLPRFINWAKGNQDIKVYGNGDQTRCFCHIKDCVRALIEVGLGNKCDREILNIGNNEEISMTELAKEVILITKSSSKIVYVPYAKDFSNQHEDIRRRVPNLNKIKKILNYEPHFNLKDIIEDMML